MERLYFETGSLEKIAREKFFLTEEIMMENAAAGMESKIREISEKLSCGCKCFQHSENDSFGGKKSKKISVVILCGNGNNGADGYVLARRLSGDKKFKASVVEVESPRSPLCKLQKERFEKVSGEIFSWPETAKNRDFDSEDKSEEWDCRKLSDYILAKDCDILVDCVYGSGFHGVFEKEIRAIMETVSLALNYFENRENAKKVFVIACDVPSGISKEGFASAGIIKADYTVTMGALRESLFSDGAKDFVGEISVANLGISREKFESVGNGEIDSPAENALSSDEKLFLLEERDMKLPWRTGKNVHKGSFGHVSVVSGNKIGAAVIAASSAFRFGAGLATIVSDEEKENIPFELMSGNEIPEKTTAIVLGPGLGRDEAFEKNKAAKKALELLLKNEGEEGIGCVLDADIFYWKGVKEFLERRSENKYFAGITVLTPHPKEFQSLYEIVFGELVSVRELMLHRRKYLKRFCEKYPGIVVLLKGANPAIAFMEDSVFNYFINPLGCQCLAKGGSGDVLSGMAAALLAQNYGGIDAAKNASLAHSIASRKFGDSFSMTPFDLIEEIGNLKMR